MIRNPQLPLLPGYSFNYNIGQTKFHKSHHFVRIGKDVPYLAEKILPGVGGVPLVNIVEEERVQKPTVYIKGEVPELPAWLVYDKQVLSFDAYYIKSLLEGDVDCNYMIRNCKIMYFLEDGTMQVVDKSVDCELAPVVFIRRQRIRVPSGGSCDDFYGIFDLNIGKEIELYGNVLKITDCDVFTRDFLNRLGFPVPERLPTPIDPYMAKKIMGHQGHRKKNLKKKTVMDLTTLGDRILTFQGYWDDRQSEGGFVHHYRILYFLTDDTIEIKDVTDEDRPFLITKRTKLVKEAEARLEQPGEKEDFSLLNVLGSSGEKTRYILDPLAIGVIEQDYYTVRDILIGATIYSRGRNIVITDMDKFTKEYYSERFGLEDLTPLEIPKDKQQYEEVKDLVVEMPPYNGFGSYEDSAINCLYLNPFSYIKAWKRNKTKEPFGYDSKVLRFMAILATEQQLAESAREFIISYYLEDSTIAVYEVPKENAGTDGGNLIRRRKIYRAGQEKFRNKPPEIITLEDFFLGNIVNLDNFVFYLKDIDEYSLKYMETHPNEFPKNNLRLIIDKVREGIRDKYKQWAAKFLVCSELRPVPSQIFRDYLLQELGNKLTVHEILTLSRHYKMPILKKEVPLEDIRCLVHDELKRLLYDDFQRLEEYFQHFDKEKIGTVSLKNAYIALRGAKVPLTADFTKLLLDRLAESISSNEDRMISYFQLIEFLNYKKNPITPMLRIGFPQIYEYEKLNKTIEDPKVNYIDVQRLLADLNLENEIKKEGI